MQSKQVQNEREPVAWLHTYRGHVTGKAQTEASIHKPPQMENTISYSPLYATPAPDLQKRVAELEEAWQPIDTAPKREGETVILGWDIPGYEAVMGFWSGEYHGVHAWCDEHYENAFNPQPTHWMPRPRAPRAALEQKP